MGTSRGAEEWSRRGGHGDGSSGGGAAFAARLLAVLPHPLVGIESLARRQPCACGVGMRGVKRGSACARAVG